MWVWGVVAPGAGGVGRNSARSITILRPATVWRMQKIVIRRRAVRRRQDSNSPSTVGEAAVPIVGRGGEIITLLENLHPL